MFNKFLQKIIKKYFKHFFGGINSIIKILVLILSSMLFFLIFSLDSRKNSYTKQVWIKPTCWIYDHNIPVHNIYDIPVLWIELGINKNTKSFKTLDLNTKGWDFFSKQQFHVLFPAFISRRLVLNISVIST